MVRPGPLFAVPRLVSLLLPPPRRLAGLTRRLPARFATGVAAKAPSSLVDRIPKKANNSGVKIYKSEETSSRSEQKVIHGTLPETIINLSAMASIFLHHCAFDALLIRSAFPRESPRFSPYFDSLASLYAVTTMSTI
jgi:hypothetical protein